MSKRQPVTLTESELYTLTDDELCRRLKKLNGADYEKVTTDALPLSTIDRVPRYAMVGKIRNEVYSCLNTKKSGLLYDVVKSAGGRVHVIIPKKCRPVLPYQYPKKIDDMLEILELNKDGSVLIAVNSEYCRIRNSFVICASLRAPREHLGAAVIICSEGTKVYVYASNIGTRDSIGLSYGTNRVYDYGIFEEEIEDKLNAQLQILFPHLCGAKYSIHPPNSEFPPFGGKGDRNADENNARVEY
ncbi:hypothetical protein FACS1894188_01350 [Clostridia bacterium]|nr:hypothetical protein FACS1894188_01350 [Clostridia bacterium]